MSELSIEGLDLLRGRGLRFEEGVTVTIREGRIESIGRGRGTGKALSGRGLLALPPLVNAHVHLGDAAFKELGLGLSLDELVKPPQGLKHRLLAAARREELVGQMRKALSASLGYGVSALADFREGGLEGLALLREALEGLPLRVVRLARPSASPGQTGGLGPEEREEARLLLREAEGLGLSGANEYSDEALLELASLAREQRKLFALHAAEASHTREASRRLAGEDELIRALRVRPSFLVHGVALLPEEAALLAERGVGLVLCPRSNAGFGSGLPPVEELLRAGVKLGLGTDNVMINEPDLFREMEFLSKAYRLYRRSQKGIAPRDILAMATVWGAELLGLPGEGLEEGSPADLLFLAEQGGLEPLKDPHASVVHRAGPQNVRALMLGGRIVFGSLEGA
jgi:cytosine/adenosine deaminase-related metal-dependent hydrolase